MNLIRLSSLSILLLASSAGATTVERFDLEEVVARAERIVVSTCQRATGEQVGDQLFTRYFFTVGETLKGTAIGEFELLLPGGHAQGVRIRIPGMPVFAPGEETVLFLTAANERGYAWPIGLGQGTFRIERIGAAKQALVFQELDGLTFTAHGAARKGASPAPIKGMPLASFLNRVRGLIAASPPTAENDAR